MKRFLSVIALSTVLMVGCAPRQGTINNIPQGVTQAQVQSWDGAVANLHKIADANTALRQAVIQLHTTLDANGTAIFPSGSAYVSTLQAIGKIDQVENSATVFLQTVPKDWSVPTKTKVNDYMQQISVILQQLNASGVTGIKNANSQQQVNTLISEITSSVTLILSL